MCVHIAHIVQDLYWEIWIAVVSEELSYAIATQQLSEVQMVNIEASTDKWHHE